MKKSFFNSHNLEICSYWLKPKLVTFSPGSKFEAAYFFLQWWVETVNVFIHCILNIFYQQYCILIHNQETKIPKKEFFTSNFEGNAQQLAGLSPGDSKTGVMETVKGFFEILHK